MVEIVSSVGQSGANLPMDVMMVETLLMNHRRWIDPVPHMVPDGNCAPETIVAIRSFQGTACALSKDKVDGLVGPKGFTFRRLALGYIPRPKHQAFLDMCWNREPDELKAADYNWASGAIGCEVEAIQAVVEQEAGIRGPWDDYGRPTILFERHKFAAHTKSVWNATHPDISNAASGGYGKYSAQYPKLFRAATLDESAALKSASWGAFQILGENHAAAGYATVEAFVDAMMTDVKSHLRAFVSFVNQDRRLVKALKGKDWTTFARIYNGREFEKNKYDTSMATIYKRLTANKLPLPKPGAKK